MLLLLATGLIYLVLLKDSGRQQPLSRQGRLDNSNAFVQAMPRLADSNAPAQAMPELVTTRVTSAMPRVTCK